MRTKLQALGLAVAAVTMAMAGESDPISLDTELA